MAVKTWDIDKEFVTDRLDGSIRIDNDSVLTKASLNRVIRTPCSRVNNTLIRAGINPDQITEAEYPDQYEGIRGLIWELLKPAIAVAFGGMNATSDLVVQLRTEANEALVRVQKDISILGLTSTSLGGQGGDSTASLGISSTTCPNARSNTDYCRPMRW